VASGIALLCRKESEDGGSDDGQGILNFEIEVNDTGCGLPPEKREAVFEAFTQADSSTTRMHGEPGGGRDAERHHVVVFCC
jgi:signal transduction histidine kinase